MRYKPERAHFIPKGAVCIKDKHSSAVAYIYESGGPCAKLFSGKRAKPDEHVRYRSPERREEAVKAHFEAVQRTEAYQAERKAAAIENRRKGAALDFAGKDYLSCSDTGALIRAALKEAFPGTRFSVRSRDSSVDVDYTDGPAADDVERIAHAFQGGYFDGMIDYAGSLYHELDGRRVHFGAKYVFVHRKLSLEAMQTGLAAFVEDHPARAGMFEVRDAGSWVELVPDPDRVGDRHNPSAQDPNGHYVRAQLAIERWFNQARPVPPKESPTLARVRYLGSDGYGREDDVNGGPGLYGYATHERVAAGVIPDPEKEQKPEPATFAPSSIVGPSLRLIMGGLGSVTRH